MSETLADLQRRMDAAAERLDFEEASRLRDRISILRGGGEGAAETDGLTRQQPGSMGLGTSRQRIAGNWKLHNTVEQSVSLARQVAAGAEHLRAEVVVAPVFTALDAVAAVNSWQIKHLGVAR